MHSRPLTNKFSIALIALVLAVVAGIALAAPPAPVFFNIFQDAVTGDNTKVTFTAPAASCSTPCSLPDSNPPPGSTGSAVDNYDQDVYERPTSQGSGASQYFPTLDIVSTEIGFDSEYFYYRVNMYPAGPDPDGGLSLPHTYGFEVNYDGDSKGDLFVRVAQPQSNVPNAFGTVGVIAFWDQNNNMGATDPLRPEGPGQSAGGYETLIFDQGSNTAPGRSTFTDDVQARIDPARPRSVILAVRKAFLAAINGGVFPPTMSFRGHAGKGNMNPNQMAFHDERSRAEMGSPYPFLQLAGAPASCPTSAAAELALTTTQRNALNSGSGTGVNTGFSNPCYPASSVYEYDISRSLTELADKNVLLVPAADMTTALDLPATVVSGSIITVTVTFTNTAPSATATTASAVVGTVTLSNGQINTFTLGNIAPGTSVVRTFTTTAPVNAPVTTLFGTSTVATATIESNTANNTGTDTVAITPAANLSISKTNGTDTVVAGSNTVYTITATNNGPSSASGAIVRDSEVPGLSCTQVTCSVSGGPPSASCPGAVTVANLNSGLTIPVFPSQTSVTFVLTCNITATGQP